MTNKDRSDHKPSDQPEAGNVPPSDSLVDTPVINSPIALSKLKDSCTEHPNQ